MEVAIRAVVLPAPTYVRGGSPLCPHTDLPSLGNGPLWRSASPRRILDAEGSLRMKRLSVNLVSESAFMFKAEGVHSAFQNTLAMLEGRDDVEVRVNSARPCDILHAHNAGPLFFGLAPYYPGRRVLTAHVLTESYRGLTMGSRRTLLRNYLRSTYNMANLVLPVSPYVARGLRAMGVVPPLRVIPNCVDRTRFQPDACLRARGRALLKMDPGTPLVLGVGLTNPEKGVREFVRVAAAVPEAAFVWVGGSSFSAFTKRVDDLPALLRAAPSCRFAGMFPFAHMPEIYNAADVLLFPSMVESFGLAPLEAAACGLPVIVRPLPVYQDLFEGVFVEADELHGFIASLRRLLSDSRHAAEMRGRSLALAARYDARAVTDLLLDAYRELRERRGRGAA